MPLITKVAFINSKLKVEREEHLFFGDLQCFGFRIIAALVLAGANGRVWYMNVSCITAGHIVGRSPLP